MKEKLILLMLLTTLSVTAQSHVRKLASQRRAALKKKPAPVYSAVPTYQMAPPSEAAAAVPSQVLNGVVRVEWVEFITPQTASVSGLYNVAIGFARGSREFCEIIDLSGRLFPTDPTACINAAGVALLRGDAPTARQYLKDLMTDARAYNNIGLLYLLEGNRDKAEVYLQLATAHGTSPGSAALLAK